MLKLKQNVRIILMAIVAVVMLASMGIFAATFSSSARATVTLADSSAEVTSFQMVTASDINYTLEGIKFSGLVSKSDFSEIATAIDEGDVDSVQFGTLIMPERLLNSDGQGGLDRNLTLSYTGKGGARPANVEQATSWYTYKVGEVEYYRFNAVSSHVPASYYNEPFVARCYLTIKGSALGTTNSVNNTVTIYTTNVSGVMLNTARELMLSTDIDLDDGSAQSEFLSDMIANSRHTNTVNVVDGEGASLESSVVNVTVTAANGGARRHANYVYTGETVTIAPASGYAIDSVTLVENFYSTLTEEQKALHTFVTPTDNGDGTYSFTQPLDNVTINVVASVSEATIAFNDAVEDVITVTYDGEVQDVIATVTAGCNIVADAEITYWYEGASGTTYTKSHVAPVNAGTYTVTAIWAGNATYAGVDTTATLIVNKADTAIIPVGAGITGVGNSPVYSAYVTGDAQPVYGKVIAYGKVVGDATTAYTDSESAVISAPSAAGNYTATLSAAATDNLNAPSNLAVAMTINAVPSSGSGGGTEGVAAEASDNVVTLTIDIDTFYDINNTNKGGTTDTVAKSGNNLVYTVSETTWNLAGKVIFGGVAIPVDGLQSISIPASTSADSWAFSHKYFLNDSYNEASGANEPNIKNGVLTIDVSSFNWSFNGDVWTEFYGIGFKLAQQQPVTIGNEVTLVYADSTAANAAAGAIGTGGGGSTPATVSSITVAGQTNNVKTVAHGGDATVTATVSPSGSPTIYYTGIAGTTYARSTTVPTADGLYAAEVVYAGVEVDSVYTTTPSSYIIIYIYRD